MVHSASVSPSWISRWSTSGIKPSITRRWVSRRNLSRYSRNTASNTTNATFGIESAVPFGTGWFVARSYPTLKGWAIVVSPFGRPPFAERFAWPTTVMGSGGQGRGDVDVVFEAVGGVADVFFGPGFEFGAFFGGELADDFGG